MTPRALHPLELLIAAVTLAMMLAFLFPATRLASAQALRTRCAGNLRQLGMAAVAYVDDKRFFPHARHMRQYAGDWTSSDPSRTVRALLFYGYLDSTDDWVCPASDDAPEPRRDSPAAREKRWFWSSPLADGTVVGGPGSLGANPGAAPFVDGLPDHSLDGTTELSYGWTRKGVNGGTRSTRVLMADRSPRDPAGWPIPAPVATRGRRGNHLDGWSMLQADAATLWLPRDQRFEVGWASATDPWAWLVALGGPNDGELAVRPPEATAW